MKAIVYDNYGSPEVMRLADVDKPVPQEDEVLVEVYAASINYVDWQLLKGESFLLRVLNGLTKPRKHILGDDIAGKVEAAGENVSRFNPGDEVFGISDFGAFAEYACADQKYLMKKPGNISFEQAAAFPYAAVTALLSIRNQGQVQPGDKVLINGASGGVGVYAVQLAKSFGAEVTGVCSTSKLDFVLSVGADHVIDYTKDDFTTQNQRFDLVVAVAGNRSIFDYKRALKPGGKYICVGGSMKQYFQAMLLGPILSVGSDISMGSSGWVKPEREDFDFLLQLIETGRLLPVVDRTFPLNKAPEALRYYGEGKAHGKVVITQK